MKTLPFILIFLIVNFKNLNSQITWDIEPQDQEFTCDINGSANDDINAYINSINASADDPNCSPLTILTDFIDMDFSCGGEVEVYVEVTDMCSNTISKTITITVENEQPYWIGYTEDFLPDDITVFVNGTNQEFRFLNGYFEDYQNNTAWTIFPPILGSEFEDDCGEVQFSINGIPPTEAFPIGIHRITYLIEDGCTQVGHSFNVTVRQLQSCENIEICSNSCETFPTCHTCDINDLINGFASCTPNYEGEVLPWPRALCNGAGVAHNISWYSFVAGDTSLCINIQPNECEVMNGAIGLQAGLYDYCEELGGICIAGDANCSSGLDPISFDANDLEIGKIYYIFVDGCNGAVCQYSMSICENSLTEFDPEAELTGNACPSEVLALSYYLDENENGVKEMDEQTINILTIGDFITLTPPSNLLSVNQNTEYHLLNEGTYTLNFMNDFFIPNPFPSTIDVVNDQGEISYEIGLTINKNNLVYDLDLEITSTQIEVCNEEVNFRFKISNNGNINVDQVAILQFDSSMAFIEADLMPTLETDSTLQWQTGLLKPLTEKVINIKFKLPDATFVGEILCLQTLSEDNTKSNSSTYCFELRCAVDPNDKHGTPFRGDENYTLFDEVLKYNIRFENLGNFYARKVRIEDQLSEDLDYESFEILQSSHQVDKFYINEEGILKIFFDSINLASIEMDSVLNKGFVQFSIRSQNGLPENTIINNTASIFFDQNEAVITNTTEHTLVSILPFSSATIEKNDIKQIKVHPNPAYSTIYFDRELDINNYRSINILNTDGKLMYTHISKERFIDIDGFTNGVYIIEFTTQHNEKTLAKFIKM